MEWIEIDDECYIPEHLEIVLVSNGFEWSMGCYDRGSFHPVDEQGYACMSDLIEGATHWMRPNIP